jgi:putative oxidoreductase
MKIAVIIVRVLVGLMFLFSSVVSFFAEFVDWFLVPRPEFKGTAKLFMDAIKATGYFMPLMMGTQFVCALAFLTGRFVPLATVVIFPIVLNILLYHVFVAPSGLVVAIPLFVANLFLAYAQRAHYRTLVAVK